MFLSHADLHALTGYRLPKLQIRWLRENGWRFAVNCRGKPIVAQAERDAQLVSGKPAQPESAIRWGEVKHGRKAA